MEYFDTIKINSKVKNIIFIKVVKRYHPSYISRNIKNMKWAINKKVLEDARKVYLNLKNIYKAVTLLE